MKRPILSLCMIVKDEETFLPQFIQAHKDLFDEWIIVDTGSTDRTRDIIRDSGLPEHSFEWCDDFSAARNYALDQCTGQWIAALDADEFLDADGVAELRRVMEEGQYDAIEAPIKNYIREEAFAALSGNHLIEYVPPDGSYATWSGKQDLGYRLTRLPRFFRKDSGLRWHSPIHEVLGSKTPIRELQSQSLTIHHLGMLQPARSKANTKTEHYRAIAKQLYSDAINSNDPKLLFEAARVMDEPDLKLTALKKAQDLAPREIPIFKALANAHLENQDPQQALECCSHMVDLEPLALEGYIARAHCMSMLGQTEESFSLLKAQMPLFKDSALYHYTLAQLALNAAKAQPALSHAKRACKLAPNSPTFARLLEELQPLNTSN